MARVVWSADHWVRCIKCVCYGYSLGDSMLPVVAFEQIKVLESRGCFRPFSLGTTRGMVLKLRRETISTFTEGLYFVRQGRFTLSMSAEKNCLCMGYVRTNMKANVNTYRGRITGRMLWYRIGKTRIQGQSKKKQTDRNVVCRVSTRLVQIQRDSP